MISVCLCETLLLPLLSPNHITKLFMLHNRQATTTHPYTHTQSLNAITRLLGLNRYTSHAQKLISFNSQKQSNRQQSMVALSSHRPTNLLHAQNTHTYFYIVILLCMPAGYGCCCLPTLRFPFTHSHSLTRRHAHIHSYAAFANNVSHLPNQQY